MLLKQETVSGSGISWAICKSAPRSRQITTPAPHHLVFTGRVPFLPPNQQRQSTEGKVFTYKMAAKSSGIDMEQITSLSPYVYGAESYQTVDSSVCPSVPSWWQDCCCGPGGQEMSVGRCMAGAQQQMRAVSRIKLNTD